MDPVGFYLENQQLNQGQLEYIQMNDKRRLKKFQDEQNRILKSIQNQSNGSLATSAINKLSTALEEQKQLRSEYENRVSSSKLIDKQNAIKKKMEETKQLEEIKIKLNKLIAQLDELSNDKFKDIFTANFDSNFQKTIKDFEKEIQVVDCSLIGDITEKFNILENKFNKLEQSYQMDIKLRQKKEEELKKKSLEIEKERLRKLEKEKADALVAAAVVANQQKLKQIEEERKTILNKNLTKVKDYQEKFNSLEDFYSKSIKEIETIKQHKASNNIQNLSSILDKFQAILNSNSNELNKFIKDNFKSTIGKYIISF
jgi:flagellar hook-length control protein FliK